MTGPTAPGAAPRVVVVGSADRFTALALDHVLLSYDYLNRHDVDGYLSLVEADVLACLPPGRLYRGRAELERQLGRAMAPVCSEQVIVVRPSVMVVTGRLRSSAPTGTGIEFVDTIVAGEHGLIRSCHRACPG